MANGDFTDIDVTQLDYVTGLIERISQNLEALAAKYADVTGTISRETKRVAEEVSTTERKKFDEIDQMYQVFENRNIKRIHLFGDEWEKTLDRLEKRWQEYGREVQRHMTQARGPLGGAGRMMGLTPGPGGAGVMGGLKNLKSQMFGQMPFGMGGLLGMALWGAKREEEFAAAGRRAAYQLQAVGDVGSENISRVTGQVRAMYRGWGSMGEEITATLSSFAQFSIAGEAFESASVHAKGFMDNIAGTATAMDLLHAAQPGTTARLIGETMMSASVSTKEAADQVVRLGAHLRELGLNYGQFAAGIVQANSALRTQNQSLDDTRAVFEKVRQGLIARGVGGQRAGQMAMERVQAAAGAMTSMPQGLQALVAQKLSEQGAAGYEGIQDPFALMTRFRLGLEQGGDTGFMSQGFEILRGLAEQAAGDQGTTDEQRLRQIGALARMGGMSEQAAAAIIDGANASEELLDPATRTATYTKDLNSAFGTYASRQSAYERDMRVMQDEMAQAGADILTLIMTIGFQIIEFLKTLPLRLQQVMPGAADLTPEEQAQLDYLDKALLQITEAQKDALGSALGHFGNVGKVMTDTVHNEANKRMKDVQAAIAEYYTAERKAEAAGPSASRSQKAGMGLAGAAVMPPLAPAALAYSGYQAIAGLFESPEMASASQKLRGAADDIDRANIKKPAPPKKERGVQPGSRR
jgi:hypothetical protein